MRKTTIYMPDEMKRALARIAAAKGVREAELIRQAVDVLISQSSPPRPRLPLFKSGKPHLAESVDEALHGFGET